MSREQAELLLADDPILRELIDGPDSAADFDELFGIYLEDPDGIVHGTPISDMNFEELQYHGEYIRADNSLRIIRV